jgi:hypothetical protein
VVAGEKVNMDADKFMDVYDDAEMRAIYAEMFPGLLFDEDCWFAFGEVGGRRLLMDASLSLATKDPEAAHSPFYSAKGEERIRAVQEKCSFKRRRFIGMPSTTTPKTDLPITVGVTRGAKWDTN